MSYLGHRSINKHDGSSHDSWQEFICGHCNTKVSGAIVCSEINTAPPIKWLLCPNCNEGSVQARNNNIYPGVKFGPNIEGLTKEVSEAYDEARNCMSVNAFTASELICRKILMHIAVEKGAKEGDTFNNYIDFIEKQGFITPPMRGWVELIKKHGNSSTHKIESPDQKRAEGTLMFTAELLRLIYEMEFQAKKYAPTST